MFYKAGVYLQKITCMVCHQQPLTLPRGCLGLKFALELDVFFIAWATQGGREHGHYCCWGPHGRSHILITHQRTQCRNNLKITAGTQQDQRVIRQLWGGNITGESFFLVTLHEAGCWKGDSLNSELCCELCPAKQRQRSCISEAHPHVQHLVTWTLSKQFKDEQSCHKGSAGRLEEDDPALPCPLPRAQNKMGWVMGTSPTLTVPALKRRQLAGKRISSPLFLSPP